jgi:hypothetical protein
MKKILSIDPSGNFKEGKGKTGFVLLTIDKGKTDIKFGTIKAENYDLRIDYWFDIASLIALEKPDVLIVEDYRLYNTASTGAAVQSFSLLETPRLLGVIEQVAHSNGIKEVVWQMANATTAYSDDKMIGLGMLTKEKGRYLYNGKKVNDHERSALRHLLRYVEREKITI